MKKIIYCIQNSLIEDILTNKKLIFDNSLVIKEAKDLTLEKVSNFDPDYIMFPHWSEKVQSKIIANFKCICFHSTPLPYGRGGSPIQNMIIKGHNQTEVCSLLMKEEFDSGPVYLRTSISLSGNLNDILIRVYEAIADQIKSFIDYDLSPSEQIGTPTIFKRLSGSDNEIDLTLSQEKIYDKIRMLDSDLYPRAFIIAGDYRIEFSKGNIKGDLLEAKVQFKLTGKND